MHDGSIGSPDAARETGRGERWISRRARTRYDFTRMPGVTDERLRAAIDAMADGAIVAEPGTKAVLINKAAREMLGIPADAVVDTTYLKDTVGFYPFDLAIAAVDNTPVREE